MCVEMVQQGSLQAPACLQSYISPVCVCLVLCDGTQVCENGVSSSSFFFVHSTPHSIPFSFFAPQLFSFSLVYFSSKMLGQIQTCTHFTSTHYNMLACLHFLLSIAYNTALLTLRSMTQTKNFNRAELDPGLDLVSDPEVSLQLVKPLTPKGH